MRAYGTHSVQSIVWLKEHTANFGQDNSDRIMPYGAYPHKSELKRCKRVHEFLKSGIFCGSYRNLRIGKVNANGHWCTIYRHHLLLKLM